LNDSFNIASSPDAMAAIRGVEKLVPTCFAICPLGENDFTGFRTTLFETSSPTLPPI